MREEPTHESLYVVAANVGVHAESSCHGFITEVFGWHPQAFGAVGIDHNREAKQVAAAGITEPTHAHIETSQRLDGCLRLSGRLADGHLGFEHFGRTGFGDSSTESKAGQRIVEPSEQRAHLKELEQPSDLGGVGRERQRIEIDLDGCVATNDH